MGLCMSIKTSQADRCLARKQREYEQLAKKARSKRDTELANQYEKKMLVIYNQRVAMAEYEAAHKAMIYSALGDTVKSERYEANVQRIRTSYQADANGTINQQSTIPSPALSTPSTYVQPSLPRSISVSQSPLSPDSYVNIENERPPAYSPAHFHQPINQSTNQSPNSLNQPINQPQYQHPLDQARTPSAPSQDFDSPTKHPSTNPLTNPSINPSVNPSINPLSINTSPSKNPQPLVSAASPMPLQYDHSGYGAEGPTVMLSPASPSANRSINQSTNQSAPKTTSQSINQSSQSSSAKNSFFSQSSTPLVPKKPLVLFS